MQGFALDDPYFLLGLVADELDRRGTRARNVAAIAFIAAVDRITVTVRTQPLPEPYVELSEILDHVGRTCRDEGIAVEQLRRIAFFEDEVNLQIDDRRGGTEIFTWPILPRGAHA